MSPRPILKPRIELPTPEPLAEPFPFATCPSVLRTPHVHFPPTPTLTSTFTTHSSSIYDRTPVVVPPNVCALPGRHERELFADNNTSHCERRESDSFSPAHSRTRKPTPKGSYFHPRAYEACAPETCSPSLLWSSPDSDSSSSDSQVSTPTDEELDVASHRSMSMLYAPTHTTSWTPPSPYHTMNPPVIPPHSYLSPEGSPPSSYSNHHHHTQSPPTKGRKSGKKSNNEYSQPRSPKGLGKLDHHHQQQQQQRSSFTFPSLDFEGCLGGF